MPQIIIPGEFPPTTSIHLATRYDTPIENMQEWSLAALEWNQIQSIQKKHPDRTYANFVNAPCPVYNCHGLTFASRRTQVEPEDFDFGTILEEDGYVRVEKKDARPGDVILYYADDGSIEHSGIVVEMRDTELGNPVPYVWSKWGKGHEVVHHFTYCPYSSQVAFFSLKTCVPPSQ